MPFHRAQKSLDFQGPIPLPFALVMDLPASKTITYGVWGHINHRSLNIYFWRICLEESLVEVSGGEAEYVETLVLLLAPLATGRRERRLDGRPQTGVLIT
jgi:hypothetical protein